MRASAAGLAVMLGACASTPQAVSGPAGDSRAERLAALLEEAARRGDPRLERASGEMAALEAALTQSPAEPQAAPEPEPEPEPEPALAPPPDLSQMARVFHAVHIASYRSLELAEAGWDIYRQDPALARLEAVAAEVELDSGRWYRLKAGPLDTHGAASALCAGLEARGEWCAVTDFNGREISR